MATTLGNLSPADIARLQAGLKALTADAAQHGDRLTEARLRRKAAPLAAEAAALLRRQQARR